MARALHDLEAEFAATMQDEKGMGEEASVVPLFADGAGASYGNSAGELMNLRRMIAELDARVAASEQRTLERIEDIERHLEAMESRIGQTGDDAVNRARSLERSMVGLADRIRKLEPR